MRKHHIGIPIVCLDKDTYELLNTYNSAAEAENDRGIPQRSIRSCCTRENNLCGGYRWMNLTDYNEWIKSRSAITQLNDIGRAGALPLVRYLIE